jgi:hypothetical protein
MYFIYFNPLKKTAFCAIEENSRLSKRQQYDSEIWIVFCNTGDYEGYHWIERGASYLEKKKEIPRKERRRARERSSPHISSPFFFF